MSLGPIPPNYELGMTLKDYEEAGNVRILSGLESIFTVTQALIGVFTELKETGTIKTKTMGMPEWNNVIKLDKWLEMEKKYQGTK